MEPIRILLADDHTLFRKGIRTLLEQVQDVEVVGEAASGREVVTQARELVPDVILMDIKMPVISGIEATRHVLQENPHIGVILVTMFDDPESVFSGMRAGARGYVLKEAEPEELRRAVEAAYRGEVILCPIIAKKVLEHFGGDPKRQQPGLPYEELSRRELQVLQLAADGLSNKEIAGNLVISEKTVKNHIANIFSKLQVNDRTQAILYALRKGLVTMSPRDAG
ncbi:MAG: response regulator [Anaerolineae bacterium]